MPWRSTQEINECGVCRVQIAPDDLPANFCFIPVCDDCLPSTLAALDDCAVNAAVERASSQKTKAIEVMVARCVRRETWDGAAA